MSRRKTVIQNIKSGGSVSINGRQFAGRNIIVDGDVVVVDGEVQEGIETQRLSIEIHGDVERVETEHGDVEAKHITGSVKTMSGDVNVSGNIGGDVSTMSGDVHATHIGGGISTMSGDIRR